VIFRFDARIMENLSGSQEARQSSHDRPGLDSLLHSRCDESNAPPGNLAAMTKPRVSPGVRIDARAWDTQKESRGTFRED